MSCTIFYKGKLKKKHSPSELFEIIIKEVTVHNWKYLVNENCLTIDFDKSISEPLVLKFINHGVSGFCKVLSHDKEIVEKIFKIFFGLEKCFFA